MSRACSYPGCKTLVLAGLCKKHSGSTASTRYPKLYGRRWRKARLNFLTENPLCLMCEDEGRTTAAAEVDHIEKHNGDPILFWDQSNWQGLCRFHHRSVKAEMERSGTVRGSRADGTPLDPKNNWHRPPKKNKIDGPI